MTSWLPPALADHLWQSTLWVIVVWLATPALRQNDARVRYWLWTAASIKFLVPLSLLVSLGASVQWRDAPLVVQPRTVRAAARTVTAERFGGGRSASRTVGSSAGCASDARTRSDVSGERVSPVREPRRAVGRR